MAILKDVRAVLQERLKEGDGDFHPLDLEKINNDKYLHRVLKHCAHDVVQSSDMLLEIFIWRKMVEANDITEENISMDYIEEGLFVPHGRDIDNCLLFIIKCNKYTKDQEDLDEIKRVVIYWLDRIERQENGNKITLFFDFTACTLANLDNDFIDYIITLCKSYYPNFLNYIIVYEMPWSMGAAYTLVRSLFPAFGVDKIKFVNKEGLRDFVNPDQALTTWGGQDDYLFEFVPEKSDTASAEEKGSHGELLCVSPSDTVYFKPSVPTAQFLITNIDENAVSYNIRTTAPNKFKIRPNSGRLASGVSQTVLVTALPGVDFRRTTKVRIIVMGRRSDAGELWQKSNKKDEHRLKCYFPEKISQEDPQEDIDHLERLEIKSVTDILRIVRNKHIHAVTNTKYMKMFQLFLLFMTLAGIVTGLCIIVMILHHCDSYCRATIAMQLAGAMGHSDPTNMTRLMTAIQFMGVFLIMLAMSNKLDDWRKQSQE